MKGFRRLCSAAIALSVACVGLFQMSGSSVILNSMAIDSAVSVESGAVIYAKDKIGKYLSNTDYASLQDISISNEAEYYSWYQVYSYLPDNTNIPS